MIKVFENYSQYVQDLFAITYCDSKNVKNYIEIGAYKPFLHSNSAFLEKNGWLGICVEPDPDKIERFKDSRNCRLLNYGISNKIGELDYISADGLSALTSTMSDEQLERIKSEKKNYKFKKVTVTKFNIVDKILSNNIINYLSIDVEGHELNVLKSINFNTYKIDLITIEVEVNNKEKIRKILEKNNFKLLYNYHADDFYINLNLYNKINGLNKFKKMLLLRIYFILNDIKLIFKRFKK